MGEPLKRNIRFLPISMTYTDEQTQLDKVAWSPRAVEDLEAIAVYISVDSTAYAASVVKTILNTAQNLSSFPFSDRVVPELGDESIREWVE